MSNPLRDQGQLEKETSRKMTPRERLDWLAVALDFVRSIKTTMPHGKEAGSKEGDRR